MILVQSNSERTLPHHFDAACALYGAIDNALYYRLTSFEEIKNGSMDNLLRLPRNFAVGSTEFMLEVFNRLGKENVRLPRNSNRIAIESITTLKEAYEKFAEDGKKLFIKPQQIKLFTGLVLDGVQYTSLKTLSDDTLILAYDVFNSNLLSEWRIYVHRHEMVDARHYSGDFTITPNFEYVREVIKSNVDFPIAYTIDVGVLEKPQLHNLFEGQRINNNVVVEFNDMWAIGNYGMPNDLYIQLLIDRYNQILNNE
jgi:hypothetical protein